MGAPLPHNESSRLEALRQYGVLDTPAEDEYNQLAQLAAQTCETPIALVGFIDEHRQWFKARYGINLPETPREVSFCAYAILDAPNVMLVQNAVHDPRFAHNALVEGSPFVMFYAGAPLMTANGHALGTLCVIDRRPRILTSVQIDALRTLGRQVMAQLELRRHIAVLSQTTRQLAEANVELEHISSAVSHDLRGPLRAIISFSHLLRIQHSNSLNPDAASLINDIDHNGHRMADMLAGFLQLLRIRQWTLHESPVDMHQIVNEVISNLIPTPADRASVTIKSLPGVFADREMIYQVWSNLLANALKFTRDQPSRAIEIGGELNSNGASYFIRDNGVGFEMAYATKLWTPFGRLHGSEFDGIGLGLSIVHRIIQRHRGSISAESAPGRGAIFRFTLPKPVMAQYESAAAA